MQNYYDTNIDQVQTEALLTMRGLPLNPAVLAQAGILPIDYPEPAYNRDTHSLEPDGGPTPTADGTAYVQNFQVVERPLADARTSVKARITAKRWQVETGGIDDPGYGRIFTGLDAQNRIATALVGIDAASASATPIPEVDFKGADGWARISADQIKVIAVIISTHVQACFSREKALHDMADAAASVADLQSVLAEIGNGWPGTPEQVA